MLSLVIGDKNLSSWSLRPWLLLHHAGLEFTEVRLQLDTPGFPTEVARYSPAGRVPVLLDGERRIWDSLAICEYVNELAGGKCWPDDPGARAHARAVSAEMHSGFAALRTTWSMRAAVSGLQAPLTPQAEADLARIDALWSDCRGRYAQSGPWLFGRYGIADAMYAPVVLRFRSYGAVLSAEARDYADTALADPLLQRWIRDAGHEVAAEGRPSDHA